MPSIIKRIQSHLPTGSPNFDQATLSDVMACYRLLLNRKPDKEGLAYYQDLVRQHHISLQMLVDSFLNSAEFQNLYAYRNEPVLVELPNFKIYVRTNDHFIGGLIAREKEYEPHVSRELMRLLKPGLTFVDIGANIGFFSLLAASHIGEEGCVIAFEPRASNRELLHQSLAANGFKQVTIYPNAVADKSETLYFSGGGADSNGRIMLESELENNNVVSIEAVVLDEILADLDQLDVIKMDIEGAEPRAWAGMQQLIERYHPVIFFEFSPELIQLVSQVNPAEFLERMQRTYYLYNIHRSNGRSPSPQTTHELMAVLAESELTHLDLLALPR